MNQLNDDKFADNKWYIDKLNHFKISLPVHAIGPNLKHSVASFSIGEGAFSVLGGPNFFSTKDAATQEQGLDTSCGALKLTHSGSREIYRNKVKFDGYSGREVLVQLRDGFFIKITVFFVGEKSIQMSFVGTKSWVESLLVQEIVDSITLI